MHPSLILGITSQDYKGAFEWVGVVLPNGAACVEVKSSSANQALLTNQRGLLTQSGMEESCMIYTTQLLSLSARFVLRAGTAYIG